MAGCDGQHCSGTALKGTATQELLPDSDLSVLKRRFLRVSGCFLLGSELVPSNEDDGSNRSTLHHYQSQCLLYG